MQKHAFYAKHMISGADQPPCQSLGCACNASKVKLLGVLVALCFALLALLAAGCAHPAQAFAKSYTMPHTTINATVETNGDLHVTEQREFDFSGNYTAVWWNYDDLPEGSSLTVQGVRMASANDNGTAQGDWTTLPSVPFQLEWRTAGGPGTPSYSFDEPENTIYAFFDETDTHVVIEVDYVIADAVQAYSDVGEVYWQFVGSGWEVDSSDVTLHLTLPVAHDATVDPGENVRAWGHGPLDSTVYIAPNGTVSYSVPQVKAGQYAEARVTFPTGWLSDVSARDENAHFSTAQLDTILNEERTWADHANAERTTNLVVMLVVIVGCLALLIYGIRSFLRYGKELKPRFTDPYWRDVPVPGEHPAVVGRIYRFDEESATDFTATIMHLANEGALSINKGQHPVKKLLGEKMVDDYQLVRNEQVELQLNSDIDHEAMRFLFDVIGQGSSELWMEDITEFAKEHPQEFSSGMARWQGIVTAHTIAGEYFEGYSKPKRMRMGSLAVILVVICVVLAFLFGNVFLIIPGIVTGVVIGIVSRFMDRRTQKGADAFARCKALRKWLTEFSTLSERPPLDVKVWGEFMVYALLFGVAKEAMTELQKVVPQATMDEYASGAVGYVPWWVWYSTLYTVPDIGDVGSAFDQALSSSQEAVTSILGGSSSGIGAGGGFSIGGGGGFGGGGGAR